MGFTPREVDDMSLWQFEAAAVGYSQQFGDSPGLSETQADELWVWLQAKEQGVIAH